MPRLLRGWANERPCPRQVLGVALASALRCRVRAPAKKVENHLTMQHTAVGDDGDLWLIPQSLTYILKLRHCRF